ncbi:putative RNA methylase [Rhizobium binae]|uniref:RNA methylase n=1 Tax=Rhizobium binae TaxID=1138190 RepID=A0ABV2MQF9_9HYPH
MTTVPFEPRRFRTTAAYYGRFRVPYPDALIERVITRTGLRPGDRLLDLGCGPGQIGIAFAAAKRTRHPGAGWKIHRDR